MALPDRRPVPLRLTADQEKRVDRQVQLSGLPRQAVLLGFVLDGLKAAEASQPQQKQNQPRWKSHLEEPAGLGISKRVTPSAPPVEQPSAGQVVVHVNSGSSGPAAGGTISHLAAWVCAAVGYQREARLRDAVDIIKCSTENEADRVALATQLDAAIAARQSSKGARSPAFALLKDFLS